MSRLATQLVLNPAAGGGRAARLLEPICTRLRQQGGSFVVTQSEALGAMGRQCREAIDGGCQRLIVAGGDGTFHEAINAIMPVDQNLQLAFIPIGTANDFCKMLGLPAHRNSWQLAVDRIVEGNLRPVDVGHLRTEHGQYYFLNGIGVGFDAEVAGAAQRTTHLPRALVYHFALFVRWLAGVKRQTIRLRGDGLDYHKQITLCAISNGQYYGGSFRLAPQAQIDDGLLDIVVAEHLSRIGVLRMLPALSGARHLDRESVRHWQTSEPILIDADRSLPIQVDGELITPAQSLQVTIQRSAMQVLGE